MAECASPRLLNAAASPLRGLIRAYHDIPSFRRLVLGALIGVGAGLAAVAFHFSLEWLKGFLLIRTAGVPIPHPGGEAPFHFVPGVSRTWLIPVFTTCVGLLTGWAVPRLVPEAAKGGTDGTDAMIKAFHQDEGAIRGRAPFIRGVASILTIASGASAGREGPISLIGAGLGSFFAGRFRFSPTDRRILLLAGAAGGLGAIFRSPLGGALTAIEVIYREDFESEAIIPAIASSVTAYFIFTLFFGADPILALPNLHMTTPAELPFFAFLALACAACGALYVRTFRYIKYDIFGRIKATFGPVRCAGLGGLAVGLLVMVFPEIMSDGWGWIEKAATGDLTLTVMAIIIVGKTVATSLTMGSGLNGGMFAPALMVGGMCGGLVGQAAHRIWPQVVDGPGGFVMVGMAAFFSGIANAPIGPLVMVCEMTQGYALLGPLMLSTAICLVLTHKYSLYEHQVESKFDSPAHAADLAVNTLERLRVRDYFTPRLVPTLAEDTTLRALADVIANTAEQAFPVRGAGGRINGLLVPLDVRPVLREETLYDLLVVRDLSRRKVVLRPDDDLYSALLSFVDCGDCPEIPVVAADDETRVLGMLSREDVFRAYSLNMSCEEKGVGAA